MITKNDSIQSLIENLSKRMLDENNSLTAQEKIKIVENRDSMRRRVKENASLSPEVKEELFHMIDLICYQCGDSQNALNHQN